MVTSYLQGGLGNQMFQIAAAWSLSKDLGVECAFDFDRTLIITQGNKANKYKDNLFKNIQQLSIDDSSFITYIEPTFSYNQIPCIDNQTLKGNFQSEKYFTKYTKEIESLFCIDKVYLNEIKNKLIVVSNNQKITSIHVRRGDYLLKPDFHPFLGIDYYEEAMKLIDSKKYLVVSDDLEWCKENFVGDQFLFTDGQDEIEDFYHIMSCDNHIIANSSFSWWSSYLCENKNKKIISPKVWFGPQGPQDTQDIYCNSWIKL